MYHGSLQSLHPEGFWSFRSPCGNPSARRAHVPDARVTRSVAEQPFGLALLDGFGVGAPWQND